MQTQTQTHNTTLPDWQADFDKWIEDGTAINTRIAYNRDNITYFWQWTEQHLSLHKNSYPVTPEVIIRFCLYHLSETSPRRLKVSTLRRYLSSVSIGHKEAGFASPTVNDQIKLLLKRAKAARIERPHQKAAITRDILDKMLSTCDNTLQGVRDRALLLVAFCSGGRRRSEMANLTTNDITKTKDGYLITLAKSKTDQDANGFSVPISGDAALALKQWLLKSGIRDGRLFRGIKSVTSTSYLLAITRNGGKNWFFIDSVALSREILAKAYPKLVAQVIIPKRTNSLEQELKQTIQRIERKKKAHQ